MARAHPFLLPTRICNVSGPVSVRIAAPVHGRSQIFCEQIQRYSDYHQW